MRRYLGLILMMIRDSHLQSLINEKIPWADPDDDSRFASAISDHKYALDPTNPRFKRSFTFVKQIAQKQKEDPTSHEQVEAKETKSKEELSTKDDGMLGTKKRIGSANEEESQSK
ncbi:unnamed protein product, partial [Brassica oleracea var. botrytis]